MHIKTWFFLFFSFLLITMPLFGQQAGKGYSIQPVPLTSVRVNDQFWSKRLEINRTISIPHNLKKCEETGRIDNFAIAGGLKKGKFVGLHFNDSDVYKVIEGASYHLATHPDPELEKYLDQIIAFIAAAQEPDGYLYTPRKLIRDDYEPPGGKERWVGIKDGSHELYVVGHMYEAAVAHHLATGKRNFLDIALKNADFLCNTFGPGKRSEVPGHQEIEIGLVKLYRLTGEEKYLNLAKFYLDERGNAKGHELMGDYAQDHKPVREQTTAVGHSVRAAYMYSGMIDVAALTGDSSYVYALDKIWDDIVSTKLYITGGLGASGGNEGFSSGYELPNLTAYCETCAGIANALWNYRMFLWHGDGKYFDIIERVTYNNILSGIGMSGDRYFYPNRLEVFAGGAQRSEWFECACCPPNDLRFLPSIPGFEYAYDDNSIFINLFIGGDATVKMDKCTVTLKQETLYPWDGSVKLTVNPEKTEEFKLKIRIPGWAQNRPIPGNLYRYKDTSDKKAEIRVNGKLFSYSIEKNYAAINRVWTAGDIVNIEFPMEVRRVVADEKLLEDNGRIALERGPIVFCLEGIDNKDGKATSLVIPDDAKISSEFRGDLLNGVQVLKGTAVPASRTLEGKIQTGEKQEFLAIPYYAWAHRGRCEMTVWPSYDKNYGHPLPAPTVAYLSKASASVDRNTDAIKDQLEPKNSGDNSVPFIHWWPQKGTTEWVQYDFAKSATVSEVAVYWFDDTDYGECRIPQSWKVFYKAGDDWKAVENITPYKVEKDKYNTLKFKPITTTAMKIEIQCLPDFSTGMFEWKVE
jgi:DUF1680 family protein